MTAGSLEMRHLMFTTLKEAALHYQEMGLRIFPLIPESKKPMAVDSQGYQAMMDAKERCLTKEEVDQLWSLYPDANIGEFPGRGSGDSVLDIDNKNGKDGFAALVQAGLGYLEDIGLWVNTPEWGLHLRFKYTEMLPGSRKWHSFGLESFNNTSNYVLLPPSKMYVANVGLREYEFANISPLEFDISLLPEFPPEINYFLHLKHLGKASGKGKNSKKPVKRIKKPNAEVFQVIEGGRRMLALWKGMYYPVRLSDSSHVKLSDDVRKRIRKKHVHCLDNGVVIAKCKPKRFHRAEWWRIDLSKPEAPTSEEIERHLKSLKID